VIIAVGLLNIGQVLWLGCGGKYFIDTPVVIFSDYHGVRTKTVILSVRGVGKTKFSHFYGKEADDAE